MRTVYLHSAGLLAFLVLAACSQTLATTITFDDLPGTHQPIPNGYGGLQWYNFYYLDGDDYSPPGTGYSTGVVSHKNVAYNAYANPADMYVNSATPFDLNSCYLTSAWYNNNNVTISGYRSGSLIDQIVVTTNTSGPVFVTLDWQDVDSVWFSSSNAHFAMDNLTINETSTPIPEPVTMAGIMLGISGLVGYVRKRRMA